MDREDTQAGARKKIVVIGGGTGSFTVLSGLKHYPVDLTAVVTMADDGGSTGKLRDEFGVLPPGDLRQCLVALSDADLLMRELFNYRYDRGGLVGHNFGNIFISTLEHMTGSLPKALEVAGEILKINGRVLPVTLAKVHLVTELMNGKVLYGEHALSRSRSISRVGIANIRLSQKAPVNPRVQKALREADMIIVGPGNLYASLVPNFLVNGLSSALRRSSAQKVYVANLMNKRGHTDGFDVVDHVRALERTIGANGLFDTVLVNTKRPPPELLAKYSDEGEPVSFVAPHGEHPRFITADLIAERIIAPKKKDPIRRTLIRHDSDKLARVIMDLLK